MFVRLFDFYALSDAAKPHPEIPAANISFLDCVPPIGTNLAMGLTTNTRVYGAQSELNHLNGTKKRTRFFILEWQRLQIAKNNTAGQLLMTCFENHPLNLEVNR
ncbi:MAG TPA: hypothetical protein VFP97_08035 [Chitinophagaceae bacterium]|nr:hypothetical protein [Chitinophagaceae bacterium]